MDVPDQKHTLTVFEYVDYRLFLADYYRARKAQDGKFSHRFIVGRVRAGSAGWFSDIVKGRTNLSGTHLVGLTKLLALEPREADYFETLVRYDQAGSMEEKNLLYKKLLSLKGVKAELVGKERFEYYSEWYHSVIRELLFFYEFRGNYAELAKKLHPPIGTAEAKRSIKILEGLGFIHKEASGVYRPTATSLKKDPAFKALHLVNFLKANIALGVDSLERFPKEERDISTMTISLSSEGFRKAKEEIKMLRDKLLALTESDPDPDRVYQCNFHMLPVTK